MELRMGSKARFDWPPATAVQSSDKVMENAIEVVHLASDDIVFNCLLLVAMEHKGSDRPFPWFTHLTGREMLDCYADL